MKGVIYARYSSDNQREESIEGQLRECKEYAERNDITILGTYIDRALSAKTDNRPEFQHMIKESAKGLFDVVLVWKLDRFARNRYDSARYKNLLKKNGVKVISARENISEGSEGIILEAMLEGYAEYYSAELSEKVIRGLTDNALKCKYNGGTVPMGYYIDEQQYYQIDPKTAPVVLEMFTKYSEGATMQELVNLLNSRGMRSIRGGKITLNIMNHLLKNRRYMGEYSYRDVIKENGIPAIVPKELFERVQERLAKNKKAPARHKAEDDYLLTTKLYCGKCGSFMVGESGTSHTMKVHRYYRCVNTKKKKLCDKKAVKKDWIEDLVVNYTMKAIMNDEVMERLIDTLMELQKKESTDLPLLKKQLAETEKGINNMLNAIQAGIFTPSTKQRLDELEETKSQLEVSILQEEMHKPLLTREQIAFFIYRFRKFDVTKREQRQRLIDSFVNAVYLYEDKIILTFNYKDGSKTITLAEVEGSDLSVLGAPEYSGDVDALGVLRVLEAVRVCGLTKTCKVYQASTSELYGKVEEVPQRETTPFHPYSPYAVAKQYGFWMVKEYRDAYGMFAVNGILFNHESERRGENFVTRKITLAAGRIAEGLQDHLELGNMDSLRDWGYAKDYVECMWLIMQQEKPDDFVIATGVQHTVRDFTEKAFAANGITLRWEGTGIDEKGYDVATGKMLVCVNPQWFRPTDVDNLWGDPTKAKTVLGWNPQSTTYEQLVEIMAKHDRERAKREKALKAVL